MKTAGIFATGLEIPLSPSAKSNSVKPVLSVLHYSALGCLAEISDEFFASLSGIKIRQQLPQKHGNMAKQCPAT
jgi:hypothetical protein